MFARPLLRAATRRVSAFVRTPLAQRSLHPQPLESASTRPGPAWHNLWKRAQGRSYASYSYRRFGGSRGNLFQRWAARPTFYYEVGGVGVACGGYYIYHLETVPVSGRKRFNIVSSKFEAEQGQVQYQQTLQEFSDRIMPNYTKEHQMVQRVLDRLVPHSGLADEKWEVHVINDDMKNAFVIPGGKVFVFRGILGICQGDDGLAAVLGHEIAHNVAHHMAERLSEMYILAPLGVVIALAGGIDYRLVDTVSSLVLSLPHSRRQEEEADYIGLLMMAEACYDPTAAVGLWSRMEQAEQGSPPQFLSTHPSSHNRLEKIRGWLPQAEERSEENDCRVASAYGEFQPFT